MNYDEQVKMFKSSIPIGPKSVAELVSILQSELNIEKIELCTTNSQIMRNATFNATHCVLNSKLKIPSEKMEFLTYKVNRDEKSEIYYQNVSDPNEFIYIIFEKLTGYLTSNSNLLFRKMELARGVSQEEFDMEGPQFQSLISRLAIAYCEKSNS